MENVPLFDAITILVGVSVFSTGFLSIRIHARRDRLLDQIDQVGQHLKDPTTLQAAQYTYGPALILEEFREYKEAKQADIVAIATALGNVGVFILVLFLSGLIIASKQWQFTTNLLHVTPEFWGLSAIALVEFGIVALGALDVFFVRNDLANRLNQSFAMSLSNARKLEREDKLDEAIRYYDEIVTGWPRTHLSTFLRGKAYLDAGDKRAQSDPAKAKEYYNKAHDDFLRSSQHFASASIYYFAAEASLKAGRNEQALREATRAITLAPYNARAYVLRAEVHRRFGDAKQSWIDRQEARRLDPSSISRIAVSHDGQKMN